ncbi:phage portal protein [Methylobacter tundripaludum]|uniref:Phage portal protein, lambda family n=1 Tax=Methylobacter tundripaludum (strain ATCC BAA-1195 / DSM 17260 / SV96) TaxID=697282 RepID=G3IRE1_METTV|nr:phage portal protein [Methylobacter tundripaludum]EGW22152.1 phage portal protein, lambda family [Methylobacter tundripaludum SV96]
MTNVVPFKRRYDAASKTTRTSNWLTPATDANSAISNPSIIRNRARDLVRNNPWANKGVSVITNNVVGYGILAQWKAKTKSNTKRAQDLWKAWAESTQCDAYGLTDFYGIQQLAMRAMVESGECFIRLRPRLASDGLAVPFQLQLLEADYLYEFADGPLQNGGYVQRGIEYDAIGRRVAYLLYKAHPGATGRFYGTFSFGYSRVPAYEVIHLFRSDRPGQERGVSWLAPVMIRLRELDIYEDAYLNRQKLANLFAAFIYTDEPAETEEEFSDVSELTPGSMYTMKPNRRIEFTTPPKADDYGPYTVEVQRGVAAGLGITFESLTGNLSEVNFSSARMGWQEFGRSIDGWRWQLFIPRVCGGVARWFSDYCGIPDLSQEWTPPARMMVDPAREIPPIIAMVRAGLCPLPEAIRSLGYDFHATMDEIKLSNDYLDQLGLILDSDPRKTAGLGQIQTIGANDAKTNKTAA